MPIAQNCIIAHAALCKVLSIWWRPILNCAVYRYRNFDAYNMIRIIVWHKTVHTFFRQVLLISEWHLPIFDFESQESNRTKNLRKLWCTRLQIGAEGVKGGEETFTYPPDFFLPLGFENSSQNFTEYSIVTFGFDPCALLPTGYRKRAKLILFSCMQWHQEVIAELIALYFINFH